MTGSADPIAVPDRHSKSPRFLTSIRRFQSADCVVAGCKRRRPDVPRRHRPKIAYVVADSNFSTTYTSFSRATTHRPCICSVNVLYMFHNRIQGASRMSYQPQFPGLFSTDQGAVPAHDHEDGHVLPATPKQMQYATSLASKSGVPLPEGIGGGSGGFVGMDRQPQAETAGRAFCQLSVFQTGGVCRKDCAGQTPRHPAGMFP